MVIEVKEFKGGRLVHHQIVREPDPESYLDERFEIFDSEIGKHFNVKVWRRPGMLVKKRLTKETVVYWKKVESTEPMWVLGEEWYHYYPVDNGVRWESETTIYKAICT